MRRREAFANATKVADPHGYDTARNPLGYNAGPLVIEKPADAPRETDAKVSKVSGNCPKCGTYYPRGLHFHVKHCGTKDEKKALGHRDEWLKDAPDE